MPFTAPINTCDTPEQLRNALRAQQEYVSQLLTAARAGIAAMTASGAAMEATFTDPLRTAVEAALAPAGLTIDTAASIAGIMHGETREEIEAAIAARYGLSIVEGRILVPGRLNLSALRELQRLVGSFDGVLALIPELVGIDLDGILPAFPVNFIMVLTQIQETAEVGDDCSQEQNNVSTFERLLGVNLPIAAVLAANAGVTRDDLSVYIFWLGNPTATPFTHDRALRFGLTEAEFAQALRLQSDDSNPFALFNVYSISHPYDIARMINCYGTLVSDVVARGGATLEPCPEPDDIAALLSETLRSRPGGATPAGARDLTGPGVSIVQVVDIAANFPMGSTPGSGGDCVIDGINLTAEQQEFFQTALAAQQSVQNAIQTAITEAQEQVGSVLNNLTSVVSVLQNFLNSATGSNFDCYFGPSFSFSVSFSTGGASDPTNPINIICNLVETATFSVTDYLGNLSSVFGLLAQLSCVGGYVQSALNATSVSDIAGLPCNGGSNTAGYPDDIAACFSLAQLAINFTSQLIASVLMNIRGLLQQILQLQLSIRQDLQPRNAECSPEQVARLTVELARRAAAAFQIPLT